MALGTAILLTLMAAAVAYKFFGDRGYDPVLAESAHLMSLTTQLDLYAKTNGFYPTTSQGLRALLQRPESSPVPQHWFQQLFPDELVDRWGHPYVYRSPGSTDPASYDLFSLGPDGLESKDDVRVAR